MTRLLLIPTPRELAILRPLLEQTPSCRDWSIKLCGFGPIAAAARTSFLIARDRPERILLIGIAGTYASHAEAGTAKTFSHVACHGIGAGTGSRHLAAGELGWQHWQASDSDRAIGDVISLAHPCVPGVAAAGHLLTCCAASADEEDVRQRTAAHPTATAEDMEGFGVAIASELAGVPLQIVRGISNVAGDRNHHNWQVPAALQAAASLAATLMKQESSPRAENVD